MDTLDYATPIQQVKPYGSPAWLKARPPCPYTSIACCLSPGRVIRMSHCHTRTRRQRTALREPGCGSVPWIGTGAESTACSWTGQCARWASRSLGRSSGARRYNTARSLDEGRRSQAGGLAPMDAGVQGLLISRRRKMLRLYKEAKGVRGTPCQIRWLVSRRGAGAEEVGIGVRGMAF